MDLIYLRFLSQVTLSELKSSQDAKEDLNLVPKCQQILRKTDENAIWRNFSLDFMSFLWLYFGRVFYTAQKRLGVGSWDFVTFRIKI